MLRLRVAMLRESCLYNVVMVAGSPSAKSTKPKPPARRSAAPAAKAEKTAAAKDGVRIFVSYSHRDASAQQKLHTHLAPWRRDGVTVWYDENIEPGAELGTDIARELRRAHIFVALFSPSYLDSNYCWNIEYKRAMSRRARKLLRVIAVVVKPCGWKQTPASGFKLLPRDGLPPERWSSLDAAFVDAARGIGEVIAAVRRELAVKAAPGATPAKSTRKPANPKAVPPSKPAAVRKIKVPASRTSPGRTVKTR